MPCNNLVPRQIKTVDNTAHACASEKEYGGICRNVAIDTWMCASQGQSLVSPLSRLVRMLIVST
jgi:hydrogenase maturation factor